MMRTMRTLRMVTNRSVFVTSSWVVLAGLALAAGALTTACGGEEQTRPPPEVTVAQPITRGVQPYVDFTGTTRAIESVEIRARAGGVLEQQLFEPSQIVEGGDVLFVIEQDVYQASRDEAVALLRSASADSALKESNLERVQIAIKTNAVSRQDLDRALAERDAAVAAVLGARARLSRAQLDYDYTMVRTPITGQVGRRRVDPGNLVGFGEQTLLTTVNRIQPIHVYFNAPEWVVLRIIRQVEAARQSESSPRARGSRHGRMPSRWPESSLARRRTKTGSHSKDTSTSSATRWTRARGRSSFAQCSRTPTSGSSRACSFGSA